MKGFLFLKHTNHSESSSSNSSSGEKKRLISKDLTDKVNTLDKGFLPNESTFTYQKLF
uniref:Uncharacterized protein n=1 Tax=Amphimedon queenslandica TaxID=400682 RepID=A0A1X7VJR6_AMPQE